MEFVTYEIAKKLKEKGFKEQCLAYYSPNSDFYYNASCGGDVEDAFKSFNSRPKHICGKRVDAPTIEQVLDWLRIEKRIHIKAPATFNGKYWWEITDFKRELSEYDADLYDSYGQAALAGIRYALDNLI